jgi:hypothetical protein
MPWFGLGRVRPTIDAIRFASDGWIRHDELESHRLRVWEAPGRDAVELHFFPVPPNLPAAPTVGDIAAVYANGLSPAGGKVVECAVVMFAGCDAVRLIVKVPQQPRGFMYQGAVTLPFRDFSYVFKVQCSEVGTTGIREAVLFERRCRAGEEPDLARPGEPFPDWNPDAAEHDSAFPNHPISRLRHLLAQIERSAVLDDRIRRLPKFPLPRSP